jgi:threonine/homoserine/homoserine lactone efflux protein
MITFLITGTLLGLSAGVAPGPLLILVISETFQHDIKSGIKVAMAPIITDAPIIGLMIVLLEKISAFSTVLGIISCVGGLFVLYLAYESVRTQGVQLDLENIKSMSLKKGVIVNALSPHPYLFWASVGGPILLKAAGHSFLFAAAFILSFYLLLVGSKIVIAILVGRSRSFLSDRAYIYTMRGLGLLLILFSGFLFHDGYRLITS